MIATAVLGTLAMNSPVRISTNAFPTHATRMHTVQIKMDRMNVRVIMDSREREVPEIAQISTSAALTVRATLTQTAPTP